MSWAQWRVLHSEFKRSGSKQQERWQLKYLHSPHALRYMAKMTYGYLRFLGRPADISIQSVWIDGTPQVKGSLPSGTPLRACELADLLLIINHTNLAGITLKRTGLLLQGKTGKRHNALPSNNSTKKERQLLEGLDRTHDLFVYRDTQAKTPIGQYKFGMGIGLEDCARYLVMAKDWWWQNCLTGHPLGPLQVGWPKSRASTKLDNPISMMSAILEMSMNLTSGRPIREKNNLLGCEWSRMVWDLLGDYEPVIMQGYGRQRRVHTSGFPSVCFMTDAGLPPPPPTRAVRFPEFFDTPPAISVIQINIIQGELGDPERKRD